MELWESYFRLWDKLSVILSDKERETEFKEKPSEVEGRERRYDYDLCDSLCLEFGI